MVQDPTPGWRRASRLALPAGGHHDGCRGLAGSTGRLIPVTAFNAVYAEAMESPQMEALAAHCDRAAGFQEAFRASLLHPMLRKLLTQGQCSLCL